MKYVIFQQIVESPVEGFAGMFMPVIIPEHVTHSQVQVAGCRPVSAGMFSFHETLGIQIHGESESLGLKPRQDDARLLEAVICNHGTYSFL